MSDESWDYRVTTDLDHTGHRYMIREVYWNDEGVIDQWSDPVIAGESIDELASEIGRLSEALAKPAIPKVWHGPLPAPGAADVVTDRLDIQMEQLENLRADAYAWAKAANSRADIQGRQLRRFAASLKRLADLQQTEIATRERTSARLGELVDAVAELYGEDGGEGTEFVQGATQGTAAEFLEDHFDTNPRPTESDYAGSWAEAACAVDHEPHDCKHTQAQIAEASKASIRRGVAQAEAGEAKRMDWVTDDPTLDDDAAAEFYEDPEHRKIAGPGQTRDATQRVLDDVTPPRIRFGSAEFSPDNEAMCHTCGVPLTYGTPYIIAHDGETHRYCWPCRP